MNKLLCFLFCLVLLIQFDHFDIKVIDHQRKIKQVTVMGEVEQPQTLSIPLKMTNQDILKMVVLREQADVSSINLLYIPKHKDVLVIPKKKPEGKISINQANIEQLLTIHGIGEKLAKEIVQYRDEHGYFQVLEDLLHVPGIKQKKFDTIVDDISL